MSLERQDVRAKLDADMHAALIAICEATVIAQRVGRIPASGKTREKPGISGN